MRLRSGFKGSVDYSGLSWFRRLFTVRRQTDPLFQLPEVIDKPRGNRIMVLAPHADDEVLGCGGTVYKHHLATDHITAVFMTNGSQGHVMAGGLKGQILIDTRENEARAAGEILGVTDSVFLRNPDGALEVCPATVQQLTDLFESRRPDLLYVPSPMETHRDHKATCLIAAHAVAACTWPVEVYLYEVWAPVPANCAVVIDLAHKVRAARAYRSQMDERELYVLAVTNLAHYRGITCLPGQDVSVECFLRLDRTVFTEFAQSI